LRRPTRISRSVILAAALAALAAQGGLRPARAAHPTGSALLVEHVKRAVVLVKAFDERGRSVAQGSGFFVREDTVVTSLHVVGLAARVEVTTYGGETRAVEGVAAFDSGRDLALLQTARDWARPVATLTTSGQSPVEGEEVFVVGNPRGSLWEVSYGKALAPWVSPELGRLLPFTAAVARGSSGGPVVNLRGQVVGVATMGLRRAPVEQFYAVPGQEVAGLTLRRRALMTFPLQPCD
jgi:S1-C subfamily serine protease